VILLQDPPLPWVTADRRILNPAIHVGTQLDKLVQGGWAGAIHSLLHVCFVLVCEERAMCGPCHAILHGGRVGLCVHTVW
jgi:hypothetical protein